MSSKEKLISRFKNLPNDFTFAELQRLLEIFGYERRDKGHTSGSRVIFYDGKHQPIMIHKPHPSNTMKLYALRQVYEALKLAGYIKD